MMDARSLDELKSLNREYLYLFVAGPGRGEALAIALPGRHWILLDSCSAASGDPPTLAAYQQWKSKDDGVAHLLLSHPHEDHMAGFADLIQATSPKHIGVAGAGQNGYAEIYNALHANTTDEKLRRSQIATAFSGIHSWETTHSRKVASIAAATESLPDTGDVQVFVRGPAAAPLEEFLHACTEKPELIRRNANPFSLVIEIVFGATRIVLPGDLPRTVATVPCPTGWNSVMASHPALADHAALKIPHHGSSEATHPQLMTQRPTDRTRVWPVTPFNSAKLPRVEPNALPWLVAQNERVHLTALPTSVKHQSPTPANIRIGQLGSRIAQQGTGVPFLDQAGIEVTPGDAIAPLDAVWCFAFDNQGNVVECYRGQAATEIVP